MAKTKRKSGERKSPYAEIRKPMPPPAKVEKDRRRDLREEQSKKDIEDFYGRPGA